MTPETNSDVHGESSLGLVLVHGSELGAWLWDSVLARLSRPAVAVDLPGRGAKPADRRTLRLEDAVQSVVDDVSGWGTRPAILVVHSFAGVLAPAIVAGLAGRVRAVAWVGATVPVEGRSWAHELPPVQRLMLRLLYRVRPSGALSPRAENRKLLLHDVEESVAEQLLDRRVPEVPRFLLDPVRCAKMPDEVPSHFVRLLEDRAQTHADRERYIARLPDVRVHDLNSGHLPMLSQPGPFAALLDRIADGHEERPSASRH